MSRLASGGLEQGDYHFVSTLINTININTVVIAFVYPLGKESSFSHVDVMCREYSWEVIGENLRLL